MLFISVPSFVVAFFMQYLLGFRLGLFPIVVSSLFEAGGSWFSSTMTHSMVMPVFALAFGSIAGLARMTRAELTESLTSDYMLLARTKGLTRASAIRRHALRNAMVPIFPGLLVSFLFIFGGSIIIEQIFSVGGMGPLTLQAINTLDYDVFIAATMFYLAIGLTAGIISDLSLGFIDPRIRMGER
jgi:oligopeptide transport system permease protein